VRASFKVGKAYTGGVEEERQERKGLSPYAKAGAYAGLAFVTPISGFVCYKIGEWLDRHYGTGYFYLVGLILGCAAGMYETVRQAVRIEGLDKRQ
jgi:F0F1-type ATP synthase assembly protein I